MPMWKYSLTSKGVRLLILESNMSGCVLETQIPCYPNSMFWCGKGFKEFYSNRINSNRRCFKYSERHGQMGTEKQDMSAVGLRWHLMAILAFRWWKLGVCLHNPRNLPPSHKDVWSHTEEASTCLWKGLKMTQDNLPLVLQYFKLPHH